MMGTGDLENFKDRYWVPRKFKKLGTFRLSPVKFKS